MNLNYLVLFVVLSACLLATARFDTETDESKTQPFTWIGADRTLGGGTATYFDEGDAD